MKTLLAFLLLLLSLPATAEIYKWTDASGRVHFGDKPTDKAAKTETLALPAPTASVAPAATPDNRLERQRRLLKVMEQERAEKERKQQALAAAEASRQRECTKLRNTLKDSEGRLIYTTDEDGVDHFLTEEQRRGYIEQLRRALQENCQ